MRRLGRERTPPEAAREADEDILQDAERTDERAVDASEKKRQDEPDREHGERAAQECGDKLGDRRVLVLQCGPEPEEEKTELDKVIEELNPSEEVAKKLEEIIDFFEHDISGIKMMMRANPSVDYLESAVARSLKLADMIKEETNFANVIINDISPSIGTHAGPGALGVIYYGLPKQPAKESK